MAVTTHPYVPAPGSVNLTVTGYNYSPGSASGFICYTFDGQNTFSDTFATTIGTGMPFTATLSTFHSLTSGEVKPLTIWVKTVGDNNPLNDTIRYTLYGLHFIPVKTVVLEEGQGTLCMFCPRGYIMLDSMHEKYGSHLATVGIHTYGPDPMAFEPYDSWIWTRVSGIPGATVDRTVDDLQTFGYDSVIAQRKDLPPPAAIQSTCSINSSTSEITIDIEVEMAAEFNGDYRVNAILIENHVTGTTSDYDQANIYANGAQGPMGIYSSLPDPVPANQMVYERVARALGGGIEGDSGSLPTSLPVNSTHTYQYIVPLSSVNNTGNIEVISLFLDDATGQILNAATWRSTTGIEETPIVSTRIFPNPASDIAYLDLNLRQDADVVVTLFDITGRVITQRNYGSLGGQQLLPLITNALEAAPYLVELQVDGVKTIVPLMVGR